MKKFFKKFNQGFWDIRSICTYLSVWDRSNNNWNTQQSLKMMSLNVYSSFLTEGDGREIHLLPEPIPCTHDNCTDWWFFKWAKAAVSILLEVVGSHTVWWVLKEFLFRMGVEKNQNEHEWNIGDFKLKSSRISWIWLLALILCKHEGVCMGGGGQWRAQVPNTLHLISVSFYVLPCCAWVGWGWVSGWILYFFYLVWLFGVKIRKMFYVKPFKLLLSEKFSANKILFDLIWCCCYKADPYFFVYFEQIMVT